MARIHPDDEQALQTMLGNKDIPPNLRTECELWTQLYHRGPHQGPLGTLPLVVLVRLCGLAPPAQPVNTDLDDWLTVSVGSRVQYKQFGDWHGGTFKGIGPGGALLVEYDSDRSVKEMYPRKVRLHVTDRPPNTQEQSGQCDTLSHSEPVTEEPPAPPPVNWLLSNRGDQVWAQRDGDFKDALFQRVGQASGAHGVQTVLVLFEGDTEPTEVPVDYVTKP